MALVIQAATYMHQYANSLLHALPSKNPHALRLGVISVAHINPVAAIHPAETHPEVILYAVASRDLAKAQKEAKQYNFTKAYGSYQELLDDPEVDMVYISTPNGLHYEWASKALKAGKHVLCEKPFTSNAAEAKKLVQEARERGLVLEEAFHWQFHPAAHLFRQILDSDLYGKILRTDAAMTASPGIPDGDIRWQFDLAGGSAMDMTYTLSFTRYALHATTPKKILSAVARPYKGDSRVDEAMHALLVFEGQEGQDVQSRIYTDMARSWAGCVVPRVWELPSIEVETEKAIIYFYNAMMPHLYHYIAVTEKATGKTRYHKQYKGGPVWGTVETSDAKGGRSFWSTYRWQMEAFVDAVKGRNPPCWVTSEDSIAQMETIDAIYQAANLPVRPSNILEKSE